MSDFKVIKEFGEARLNDVFCYNAVNDVYELCYLDDDRSTIVIDANIVLVPFITEVLLKEGYLKEGYLEEVKAEPVITPEETKLKEITDFVYQQIENCKKDNTVIANKFEKGEVQPCVKVESDTVHYNLLKVLNHIKDLINE